MISNRVIPKQNTTNNSLYAARNSGQENSSAINFNGGLNSAEVFSTKIHYKELCTKEKFNNILNLLEPSYKSYFEDILNDFRTEIKKNPHSFKDMPENVKKGIENGHIFSQSQKGFLGRAIDAMSDPITYLGKSIKNNFVSKEKLAEIKRSERLKNDYANVEGLVEYVNNLKEKDPASVKKLLQEKIKKNFTKVKANYSSNIFALFLGIADLGLDATFHGMDFYNMTRGINDSHEEAMGEAKIKVKQDIIRRAVNTYLLFVASTLFKKDCNRSMSKMLLVVSTVQLAAEIINRKATGRPILPLNTKSLKAYQEKQDVKTDFKKQETKKKDVSFTGASVKAFFSKDLAFSKSDIQKIMDLTQKINPEQAKRYTTLIEEKLSGSSKGKKLASIYMDKNSTNISLGKKESTFERAIKCILIPITGLVKLVKKLSSKEKATVDEFLEVKNYLSFNQKLLKNKYKNKDVIKNSDDFNAFKKDIMDASLKSFRSSEANYNVANYSIIKKIFSYAIFTTFISWDAYNITMLHSNGDKKKSQVQSKQRILQEVSRFFITMYASAVNLTMFSTFFNKSVGNAVGFSAVNSILGNIFTRKALGLPITPKNKKQLDALDEKNKKSSFYKQVNKLTGKDNN